MVRARMLAASFVCSLTGCLAVYSQRPVEITVTSAETGRPVPDLPVSVNYAAMMVLNIPRDVKGVTDKDGRVVLPVADFSGGPIHVNAGDYGHFLEPEQVRNGGTKETAAGSLRLVPQRPSFAQRVFGWVR
jgi:hypothetical protein